MFDELDEDPPFVPSPRFRAGVERRARALRRRTWAVRTAGIVLVLGVATSAALAIAVQRRDAAIDRIDVVTNPSVDGAVNVLVLGTDRGDRADTAAIVRFQEDGGVAVLTIPRDLWVVDADGRGRERINASLADGPDGYVAALDRATGIPVDHVVQIGFAGFSDLVDAVGGLQVSVLTDLRDRHLGMELDRQACATLDGDQALQLARTRYLQYRTAQDGWLDDPMADLGRGVRTQVLAGAVLQQLQRLDPGPGQLDDLSQILADHAVLDDGLTLGRIVELGQRLLGADGVEATGLPVVAATTDSGAAVLRRQGGDDVVRRFGAVDPPPPDLPEPQYVPGVHFTPPAYEQIAPCGSER